MPLKQTEICCLLQSDSAIQQSIYACYTEKQVSIEVRILLGDWINDNAELWHHIHNGILPEEANAFLLHAVRFLDEKLQNSENELYKDKRQISLQNEHLKTICSGAQDSPEAYLLRLQQCLLKESGYYFKQLHHQDDIDEAVINYSSCSTMLAEALDSFVNVLEQMYTSPVNTQALWQTRQSRQEVLQIATKTYLDAQKRIEVALLTYRASFSRQIARESFAEKPTLNLEQLQPAYDTAAKLAMADLARLQVAILFSRHVREEDMALNFESTFSEIFAFLCNSLVTQCLVLERQMPQIVRKGAKFAITPQLRMLCPSVLFPGGCCSAESMVSDANGVFFQPLSRASTPANSLAVRGGLTITKPKQLRLDAMVQQKSAAQDPQARNRDSSSLPGKRSNRIVSHGSSNSNVAADVDVNVFFLSETQAQEFVKNLVLPKPSPAATMNPSQLTFDNVTKHCGAAFKALSVRGDFSRGDRKHSHLVTEEKYCLAFTCGIPLRGLSHFQDTQQHTTVLASVLSLPIVVTVHNSQEASAAIATLWDNYFAEMNRLPFEVPRRALWGDVKNLLNGRWKAVCGRELSEQNLAYLAMRLLSLNGSVKDASNCDNVAVTWTMIAKDMLPMPSSELPRFTFWDWFHSCLKMMSKDLLRPFWPNHMVGFASHEQVEEMLHDCKPGTFLLRFASTELGAVVFPYARRLKGGRMVVERGLGPCDFKACEPKKLIGDLEPLKLFYPSMRTKQDVLLELANLSDAARTSRKKKKRRGSGGYEKPVMKITVGPSSSSEETDDGAESMESMNCDAMSNTPPSVSPVQPTGASSFHDDEAMPPHESISAFSPPNAVASNSFLFPAMQNNLGQASSSHGLASPTSSLPYNNGFSSFAGVNLEANHYQ